MSEKIRTVKWTLDDKRIIHLVHEDDFHWLPLGTVLYSINGHKKIIGKDEIDTDSRGGYLAFGLEVKP